MHPSNTTLTPTANNNCSSNDGNAVSVSVDTDADRDVEIKLAVLDQKHKKVKGVKGKNLDQTKKTNEKESITN